jgi:hypothetical protein
VIAEARSDLPAKLISELVTDPEFPNSAVGEKVDIRGYIGVIVAIVHNSIKVRSSEGNTVSYNFHTLRRLYGPRLAAEPEPAEPAQLAPAAATASKSEAILEPNFSAPLVPIELLVQRPDFPSCAFGVFVDLHGFTGVVVELVGHSLKIQSREGSTRRYNGDGLRKIYGMADGLHQRVS